MLHPKPFMNGRLALAPHMGVGGSLWDVRKKTFALLDQLPKDFSSSERGDETVIPLCIEHQYR